MNPRIFVPLITALLLLAFILTCPSMLSSQVDPAAEWHLLYLKIRDSMIAKEEAQGRLKELEVMLKQFYLTRTDTREDDRLFFPLSGYGPNAIGGERGSGYITQGYDFFDGNDHKGHPGHDLFIRDKNQDGVDDGTGKPVEVVSASQGIVVSVHLNWEPSSPIRGGNYIWVHHPMKSQYFYYAHLDRIFVRVGQIVSKGEPLGTVGRTGVNAYPKRSPTHLHFVVHQSVGGYPKPINPYTELVKASLEEK